MILSLLLYSGGNQILVSGCTQKEHEMCQHLVRFIFEGKSKKYATRVAALNSFILDGVVWCETWNSDIIVITINLYFFWSLNGIELD